MSNFGRAMLEKFGWKEGKGLGKEESGISKPIKVNGNFNAYGLGHDVGQEFTNQWWDHLYNKTAGNVSVDTTEDGSVKFTRTGDLQVSQKVIPYANAESSQYSRFVKAGVVSEPQEEKVLVGEALSYDEIFKISGGRTAHKGARHGLTMAAKLARVEKQERELLDKWKTSKNKQIKDCSPSMSVDFDENIESIKKKRKKSANSEGYECNSSVNNNFESAEREHLPKKHKKKKKTKLNTEKEEFSCTKKEQGESVPGGFADEELPHRRKKREKNMGIEIENINGNQEQIEDLDSAKKKHKKKHRKPDCYEKENAETEAITYENEVMKENRRKKSTRKSNEATEINISGNASTFEQYKESEDLIPEVQTDLVHKKKKKKPKKLKMDCDS